MPSTSTARTCGSRPPSATSSTRPPTTGPGFGDGLTFSGLTRWTANNEFAWPYYRRDTRATRAVASITNAFGRVLFHELSHAADFFPPSIHASLDPSKTPNELYLPRFRAGQLPSSVLAARLPLGSSEMKALGQVLFAGAMATDRQKGYQPAQVAEFFRGDRANDTYSYSTAREDLAMLVEEFMMAHRRGVRRDIAITNRYMTGLPSDQLIVSWGQRGRIGDPGLRARVQFVLGQIVPWIDPGGDRPLAAADRHAHRRQLVRHRQAAALAHAGRRAAAGTRRRRGPTAGAGAGPAGPAPAAGP